MAAADLVVVHGGGVTAASYTRLAKALAGRITVHLYDRRGRGDAGPKPPGYTVDDEVADLAAVLLRTGARSVLGHSYGGLVALRAALELPLDNVVLYEGAVNVDGVLPPVDVPRMRGYVEAGDVARAIAVMGGDANPSRPGSAARLAMVRAFLLTPIGRRMGELMPTTLRETEEVAAHSSPASDYAGITARTLLARGARGPAHYRTVNERLAAAIPGARTRVLPRSSHNAPCVARPRFVRMVADFLTGAPVPA
jgi:pimeloyl-ACP methyl ester carboxylesterase